MSANKYSKCGGYIEDATGTEWPVEAPHPLPLPEGIEQNEDTFDISFGSTSGWTSERFASDTHWLARRPLPEVPRSKTQEELDMEWCEKEAWKYCSDQRVILELLRDTIAYARKCPSKPAA